VSKNDDKNGDDDNVEIDDAANEGRAEECDQRSAAAGQIQEAAEGDAIEREYPADGKTPSNSNTNHGPVQRISVRAVPDASADGKPGARNGDPI